MARARSKKEIPAKNVFVSLRRIPSEELKSILNRGKNLPESKAFEPAKDNILEEKVKILEEELCMKNQLIESLQEQIKKLKAEKNHPEIANKSFNNLSQDIDLSISVDKLLQCKAIAKRMSEVICNENPSDKSKLCISSEDPFVNEKARNQDQESKTSKAPKERRRGRKNTVSTSSIKNMSDWLALGKKENVDQSADSDKSSKRKRPEEDNMSKPVGNFNSQVLFSSWIEPELRLKSFASQYAKEVNLTEKQ